MLILSWNVAGLSTTVNRIHEAYGKTAAEAAASKGRDSKDKPSSSLSSSSSQKPPPSSLALRYFFERHCADIVCLQEHKIPRSQLSNRCEPRHASRVEGYESFWCCNACSDPSKRGFNGVVTYCRKGLVVRADPSPLGSTELDQQGRCVVTDHGTFVLFNVYVPASGGGRRPLNDKMKFLNALRRRMQLERKSKPVILVGDLNIAHTQYDIPWISRMIHVNDILEEVVNGSTANKNDIPRWKEDVAEHWGAIEQALKTKEVVPIKTTNPTTKEEYQKYRLAVTVTTDNKSKNNNNSDNGKRKVLLGKHESDPEDCLGMYNFDEQYADLDIVDNNNDTNDTDGTDEQQQQQQQQETEEVLVRERNAVSLHILAELMSKIANVSWNETTMRSIAESEVATTNRVSPARKWLSAIIDDDGMVDAFRYYYPDAKARFTCWDQFTNCRYVNNGARIDMTLIDKSLLEHIDKGNVDGLRGFVGESGGDEKPRADSSSSSLSSQRLVGDNKKIDCQFLTEKAALAAATANGRYQPVSFEGGGIQEVSQKTLDTQFGVPHTGMIYTPPSFSDHIGISLLLNDAVISDQQQLVLDETDSSTRKAQPHKLQKTIASFFDSSSSTGAAGKNSTAKKRPRLISSTTAAASKPPPAAAAAAATKIPANSVLNKLSAQPKKQSTTDTTTSTTTIGSNGLLGGGVSSTNNNKNKRPISASYNKKAGKLKAGKKKKQQAPKTTATAKNSILNHFQRRTTTKDA